MEVKQLEPLGSSASLASATQRGEGGKLWKEAELIWKLLDLMQHF